MRTKHLAAAFAALAVATAAWADPPAQPRSLYDRLGGLKGITQVVDDFIDHLVVNERLNQNPRVAAARTTSPPPYLKFQVAQLVCQATGGPCQYTGKPMKEAHLHLFITEPEWQVMAAEFKKSLDKFKVPKREQDELFAIVGGTKGDIVVPGQTAAGARAPQTRPAAATAPGKKPGAK